MIWVAVDAMAGDYAPRHAVDGALAAARHFDLGVALVGLPALLEPELLRHPDRFMAYRFASDGFIQRVEQEIAAVAAA